MANTTHFVAIVHLLICMVQTLECIPDSLQPTLNVWYGCVGNDTNFPEAGTVTQILCDGPYRYFNPRSDAHGCPYMIYSLVDDFTVPGVNVIIDQ